MSTAERHADELPARHDLERLDVVQRQQLEEAGAGFDQQRVTQHHIEQRRRPRRAGEILRAQFLGVAGVGEEPVDVVQSCAAS